MKADHEKVIDQSLGLNSNDSKGMLDPEIVEEPVAFLETAWNLVP